jgi:AraC family transcriptional regulator
MLQAAASSFKREENANRTAINKDMARFQIRLENALVPAPIGKRHMLEGIIVDLNPPGDYEWFIDTPRHMLAVSLAGGQAQVRLDGTPSRAVTVPPGGFDLLPGHTPTHAFAQTKSGYLGLIIEPAYLNRIAHETTAGHAIELQPRLGAFDPTLAQLGQLTADCLATDQGDNLLYLKSLVMVWLVHLIATHSNPIQQRRQPSCNGHPRDIQRALDYIHSHLDSNLSLVDIASAANKSPYHFARLFRATMQVTPHRYVTLCRLNRAQALLTKSHLPLNQIAMETGFCNQSHMTHLFRKYLGLTPGQARRRPQGQPYLATNPAKFSSAD